MNRGEIRDRARKQMGEVTASFWTDAELNLWIDETCADLAWRTKSVRKNGLMTPVVSTMEYTLTDHFSDWLDAIDVYFKTEGTTWKKLTYRKRSDMDAHHPGWLSASDATPVHYSYDTEEDWLLLWPPPNANNTGASYVRAFYSYRPAALASDATISPVPLRLHDAIVEGVKVTAYESRGLGDRANNSRTIYLKMIKDYTILRENHEDEEIVMKGSY